jgi:hypothetical protein
VETTKMPLDSGYRTERRTDGYLFPSDAADAAVHGIVKEPETAALIRVVHELTAPRAFHDRLRS